MCYVLVAYHTAKMRKESDRNGYVFIIIFVIVFVFAFVFGNFVVPRELLASNNIGSSEIADSTQRERIASSHLHELQISAQELLSHIKDQHFNVDGSTNARVMVNADGESCSLSHCAKRYDITCAVSRLLQKHHIHNSTPDARLDLSHHDSEDNVLAVNEDKGKQLSICVFPKNTTGSLVPENKNTLFRVLVHELAHSMHCEHVRTKDHGSHFGRLEGFLLFKSKQAGLYKCPADSSTSLSVCGKTLPLSSLCGLKTSTGSKKKQQSDVADCPQDSAPDGFEALDHKTQAGLCASKCTKIKSSIMPSFLK